MSYHKIKFEHPISDYQRNIIVKLVEHIHAFSVTAEQLEKYWSTYNLPLPYNYTDSKTLLQNIEDCSELCIQDTEGGKIYYDIRHNKHYTSSIHLNEWIRHLDKSYAEFANNANPTNQQIESMAGVMRDSLMLMNNSMFLFHFMQSNNDDMTLEEAKMLYPDSNFYGDAVEFHRIVSAVTSIDDFEHSGHGMRIFAEFCSVNAE